MIAIASVVATASASVVANKVLVEHGISTGVPHKFPPPPKEKDNAGCSPLTILIAVLFGSML